VHVRACCGARLGVAGHAGCSRHAVGMDARRSAAWYCAAWHVVVATKHHVMPTNAVGPVGPLGASDAEVK